MSPNQCSPASSCPSSFHGYDAENDDDEQNRDYHDTNAYVDDHKKTV